jgi:uncharacterized BrkB/YihY/UPF0761 family membrane protein
MVPLLIVIIAIIGLAFGQEAAQSALMDQLSRLSGPQSRCNQRYDPSGGSAIEWA